LKALAATSGIGFFAYAACAAEAMLMAAVGLKPRTWLLVRSVGAPSY